MWHSEEKYDYVVHAEMNALLHSTGPLKGATLYVTMYPCKECAKAICSAGISKVYYLDPKYQSEIADKLFKSCGIDVELIIGGTSGAEG